MRSQNLTSPLDKIVFGIILSIHGIGHALGWFLPTQSSLTPFLGDFAIRALFLLLWTAALIGFLAVGIAMLAGLIQPRTRSLLAVMSVVVSLLALLISWDAVSDIPRTEIVVVDVLILIAAILPWTSSQEPDKFDKEAIMLYHAGRRGGSP